MRIVVLGGYGNFGARICRTLADDPDIELVSVGRRAPGEQLVPRMRSAQIDLASPNFSVALRALAPNLVIHCAGPFQGQDYRIALAAINADAHYVDLADGR